MKFSLNQIKRQSHNGLFVFDQLVDVSELETMNNDIRSVGSVRVNGKAEDQGNDIIFTFNISGEAILPCARTLVDVPYLLSINAIEVFSESAEKTKDSDDEIHLIDGYVIDLDPLIKENILLDIPYRVFSDHANDESQTPFKGEGWELVLEEDNEPSIDPRMKKLETLLENKDKK